MRNNDYLADQLQERRWRKRNPAYSDDQIQALLTKRCGPRQYRFLEEVGAQDKADQLTKEARDFGVDMLEGENRAFFD